MKLFALLTLLTVGIATAEARTHFNFGFGVNVVQPRSHHYYVEEYYYPQERIVYVEPMPVRRVHVVPAYHRPAVVRPFFSLGLF